MSTNDGSPGNAPGIVPGQHPDALRTCTPVAHGDTAPVNDSETLPAAPFVTRSCVGEMTWPGHALAPQTTQVPSDGVVSSSHESIVPVSCRLWSVTRSCQVPAVLWPSKAESGCTGFATPE